MFRMNRINQSVNGGKIASNFIDQSLLYQPNPNTLHSAQTQLLLFSTLFWQLLLKLTVNLFNSIRNY